MGIAKWSTNLPKKVRYYNFSHELSFSKKKKIQYILALWTFSQIFIKSSSSKGDIYSLKMATAFEPSLVVSVCDVSTTWLRKCSFSGFGVNYRLQFWTFHRQTSYRRYGIFRWVKVLNFFVYLVRFNTRSFLMNKISVKPLCLITQRMCFWDMHGNHVYLYIDFLCTQIHFQ